MRSSVLVMLLILSGMAQASTLIDFDSQSLGPVESLVIDGFKFTPSSGLEIIQESPGDNALFYEASGSFDSFGAAGPLFFVMQTVSGDPFAFYGADIVGTSLAASSFFGATGYTVGGGIAAGSVGTGDWLNLQSITFEVSSCCGDPYYIETLSLTVDNINASVVPIPAAVWLFGSALVGLGWVRRMQSD
ncbi:MAG: VPLPA-CTERM sorting domain-containing protein [Gammaproteobacteria bacterium]|jgi:hypothetical protein